MNGIVFSKMIRVRSKGRFITKKGITLGPERFFHKEEVQNIKDLLMSYPNIQIEERTSKDQNIVMLNMTNYNKVNERVPVGMEENVDPVPDTDPEAEPEENPQPDTVQVGEAEPKTEPDAKEEPQKQQQQNNNQQSGGKKRNKNRNKETTEVTPKEA